MFKQLLLRPIAVSMTLIAITVLGLLATRYIPVSLMPDIDIPRITVQMSKPGASVAEIEKQMVNPMRQQLSQVAGLKDIKTVSKTDVGNIVLTFEPGANMDLLFIDVSEKVDRAMNLMPRDMPRPKVVKASVMDIPAFFIDVTKTGKAADTDIAQLSSLVTNVIAKRIEQLPQVAMVDYSGTVGTEIDIVPDEARMKSAGISVDDMEYAISSNNLLLEALSIANGIYRYTVHFDSQLLTVHDIENIYINHQGRLLQLKDIASFTERSGIRHGIVKYNDADAVTIAVIKQADAQMADLRDGLSELLQSMHEEYPDIKFEVTRDQTELLDYTMTSLGWNLLLGAMFACMVLFVFNGGWRIPLLVVISIPLSLIITLLCFYVFGISLNIISLSGLILGVGMIVDNSIIVIDNITQRKDVVAGTREVFMPMLSSVLTTCSVFLPLIFLSGTAGALFYDQAVAVSAALFSSLLVASLVVPVYYYNMSGRGESPVSIKTTVHKPFNRAERMLERIYSPVMSWTLRNGKWWAISLLVCICLAAFAFAYVRKERMPDIEHDDVLVSIDWNKNISAEENSRRTQALLASASKYIDTSVSMAGVQEFILSHTKDITANEAIVYIKSADSETLEHAKTRMAESLKRKYPEANIEFCIAGNVYDLIFQTDNPDLEIRLQRADGSRPKVSEARHVVEKLISKFPAANIQPVSAENIILYVAHPEQMALYGVTYNKLYSKIKELAGSRRIFEIASGDKSIPVVIGCGNASDTGLLQSTVTNGDGVDVPLEYLLTERYEEDYKRLFAGTGGEYYPISISNASAAEVADMMEFTDSLCNHEFTNLAATYHGDYHESRQMIGEMAIILVVVVLLLYFILAAQFESMVQPLIILSEIVADVAVVLVVLWCLGESVNIMSMIGVVVMSGIIINNSILKVDTINRLYRGIYRGNLLRAILVAGHKRLKPIVMTSLTTILALLPFLAGKDAGSALQYPLSVTLIIGMTVGTMVSLWFVPLVYYAIYHRHEKHTSLSKKQ